MNAAIASGLDAAEAAVDWLSGDATAPLAYADRMRKSYAQYLAHRNIYYGMERRWHQGSFWKTRHTAPAALHINKVAAA